MCDFCCLNKLRLICGGCWDVLVDSNCLCLMFCGLCLIVDCLVCLLNLLFSGFVLLLLGLVCYLGGLGLVFVC